MSLMPRPWITIGAVLLIYGLGAVSGWFSNQLAHHSSPNQISPTDLNAPSPFEEMLDNQLQLSADQKTKIHEIMVHATEQAQQIRSQIQPQMQQLRVTTLKSIQAELDSDQQKEFDLLRKLNEVKRRRQRANGGGGGGNAGLDLNYPRPSNRPGSAGSTNVVPLPIPNNE